ncbi:hypothetical protein [Aureivirga marina]|uniref:hypothetical protein n=1 Tax=Aureivirga marina TaxID=1182451 RepID=UPI0018C99B83|nr:hypothetical protein [Aureivirga marina]
MNQTLNLQKISLIFGIPILLYGCTILLSKSSVFAANPNLLSIGITFDLLLTTPLIYFLLIRKTKIPKTTVIPLTVLGIVIGTYILPSQHQEYLSFFKYWILPIVEISVFSYIVYTIVKLIKQYKLNKTESDDFFIALKTTCNKILPKGIVIPFVTEISVIYYGFIYWRKRKLKENEFSYHKESGIIALLITFLFLIFIETIAIHILLEKWNYILAWIITFLSIYTSLQVFGFLKSMYKRPYIIENNTIFLRHGIMSETTIDINSIESIEISSKDIEFDETIRSLSIFGAMDSHNLIIHLKKENQLLSLYGIKKTYKSLAIHVDDKILFKNTIENNIPKSTDENT